SFEDIDVRPAPSEPRCEARVELDGDDAPCDPCDLGRQPAGARADVDDELITTDSGAADDLGGKARAEKMLATRWSRPRATRGATCHGASGQSSCRG